MASMGHRKRFAGITMMLLLMLVGMVATPASASPLSSVALLSVSMPGGSSSGGEQSQGTCTDQGAFQDSGGGGGGGGGGNSEGLLTQVVKYVKDVVDEAAQKLFQGVISSGSFQQAVGGAVTLYVAIYGILFIFGIVPLTLTEGVKRLIKVGLIYTILTQGWGFFSETVVQFFNEGTDELINAIMSVSMGPNTSMDGEPFAYFDKVAEKVLSSKFMVSIIGSLTTGPYGMLNGGLQAVGAFVFILAVVNACKTYCISLVAKALLFGIAPAMFVFFLFERTKHIFTGWVNQLINFSLQPLLLFGFVSFFLVLINSAAQNILKQEWCWTDFQHVGGTPQSMSIWRPKDGGSGASSNSPWDWKGSVAKQDGKDHPVPIIDVLTFLVLCHLCWRFSTVVTQIASEISSSQLYLDKLSSGLGGMMGKGAHGVGDILGLGSKGGGGGYKPPPMAGGRH